MEDEKFNVEKAVVETLVDCKFSDYELEPKVLHLTECAPSKIIVVTVFMDALGTMGMNMHYTFVLDKKYKILKEHTHKRTSNAEQVTQFHETVVKEIDSNK
jgi:hypothetical protein